MTRREILQQQQQQASGDFLVASMGAGCVCVCDLERQWDAVGAKESGEERAGRF